MKTLIAMFWLRQFKSFGTLGHFESSQSANYRWHLQLSFQNQHNYEGNLQIV
jgi:hypothetical protein